MQLPRRELRHFVISPAQFEAKYGLLVFALEQHRVAQLLPQHLGHIQRRLFGHIIYAGVEDFFQIVVWGECGSLCHACGL